MKTAVLGIVDTRARAESIVSMLRQLDFAPNELSVLLPDGAAKEAQARRELPANRAPEAALAGAGTGGVLGGALGRLAGIGALAIPGVGPLLATGPLMATLSGAALGAALGGLTGALIGLGIPEQEARLYEAELRGGNILIAIHTDGPEAQQRAEEALRTAGVRDVSASREDTVRGAHVARHL